MKATLETILKEAKVAALKAAEVIKEVRLAGRSKATLKGTRDLVTEADTAAEAVIVSHIKECFPEHKILAEEDHHQNKLSGQGPAADLWRGSLWVIDPVDGTTNFAHGHLQVGTSIAYLEDGVPLVGVVNSPFQGELFSAIRGGKAYLNDQPISVTQTSELIDALVATGFPYDRSPQFLDPLFARLRPLLEQIRDLRRFGAASLDICWVACGRIDGYFEDLAPWDMAAGIVIAEAAGAKVGSYQKEHPYNQGLPELVTPGALLVANPSLYEKLERLLQDSQNNSAG